MSLKFIIDFSNASFLKLTKAFMFLIAGLFSFSALAVDTVKTTELERKKKFVEADISGSVGNYNGVSYTELHLGVNLNLTDWLTWRNSAFKRMKSGSTQEQTGLDSTLRLSYDTGLLNFYAGPGYRWSNMSDKNAILAEAGASIGVDRISLGAGAKYLRYDKAQFDAAGTQTKRDDFSYFVTISGGAALSF
jgi:hypothetical protein